MNAARPATTSSHRSAAHHGGTSPASNRAHRPSVMPSIHRRRTTGSRTSGSDSAGAAMPAGTDNSSSASSSSSGVAQSSTSTPDSRVVVDGRGGPLAATLIRFSKGSDVTGDLAARLGSQRTTEHTIIDTEHRVDDLRRHDRARHDRPIVSNLHAEVPTAHTPLDQLAVLGGHRPISLGLGIERRGDPFYGRPEQVSNASAAAHFGDSNASAGSSRRISAMTTDCNSVR